MQFRTFIIAVIIAMALSTTASAQSEDDKKINLLYLNSYENGYQWSDTVLEGIKSILQHSGMNIDLHIEYMDTKIRYDHKVKMHLFAIYALQKQT